MKSKRMKNKRMKSKQMRSKRMRSKRNRDGKQLGDQLAKQSVYGLHGLPINLR